ncbi:MAG: hypothetical protein AAF919_05940 [Pseudomonadota bacterium]
MFVTAIALCLAVVALFVFLPMGRAHRPNGPQASRQQSDDWDDGVVLNPDFVKLILARPKPRAPTATDTHARRDEISSARAPRPAEIVDFDPKEERLEILYDEDGATKPPALRIVEGEAGVELRVDGFTVARLAEGTRISAEDVSLIRRD